MIRRLLHMGVKLEALQLAFTIGAICGMIAEAILITVPKILFAVVGAIH